MKSGTEQKMWVLQIQSVSKITLHPVLMYAIVITYVSTQVASYCIWENKKEVSSNATFYAHMNTCYRTHKLPWYTTSNLYTLHLIMVIWKPTPQIYSTKSKVHARRTNDHNLMRFTVCISCESTWPTSPLLTLSNLTVHS